MKLNFLVIAMFLLAAPSWAGPTLKDAFDFLVGAAINPSVFYESNGAAVQIVTSQFNTITPENSLKWESVHPSPHVYDFTDADRYVEFGVKHKMFIIGHTLVWHYQTPPWVFEDDKGKPVDRETLLARMREHIHMVMGRYKGRIGGWDVVNEAVDEKGGLRQTPWLKIIGEDYLLKAYQFAAEADPNAQLYYNDYSLEKKVKRDTAIELIQKLQAQGVKIAGVGIQCHSRLDSPGLRRLDEAITGLSALGVKVMITELDIDVLPKATQSDEADVALNATLDPAINPYTNGLPDEVQQTLARRYADMFSIFVRHRGQISRVTFWGVTDGDSWCNDWPVRGRTDYPLLFDRAGNPKPAYQAVLNMASPAPTTNTSATR